MMLLTGCKNNILAFIDDEFYNKVIKEQKNGKFFSIISNKDFSLGFMGDTR